MRSAATCIMSLLIYLTITVIFPIQSTGAGEVPEYDRSVFTNFPESQAIEKMLLQEKMYDILQTSHRVLVDSLGDFGTGIVRYQSGDKLVDYNVFLLKKEGVWTAYPVLPADNDHPVSLVYELNERQEWQISSETPSASTPQEKVSAGKADAGKEDEGAPVQNYPLHLSAAFASLSPDNEMYALQLVKEDADVNELDEYGRTPLHILCGICKSPGLVQALIDAGADVNIKTMEGNTPMDLLTMMMKSGQPNDCPEIRAKLLKAGAE
ncbi:MAG: hypothetical protein OEM01_11890 [Desulfobulbaceae bacterium]|nr:hypothetical protein [Desulfobulbaceae bacterium]